MSENDISRALAVCRELTAAINKDGTFRLRVLMQMILLELENERAAKAKRVVSDRDGPVL